MAVLNGVIKSDRKDSCPILSVGWNCLDKASSLEHGAAEHVTKPMCYGVVGLYPKSISLILFQNFFNFLQSLVGLFLRQSLKGHPEVMILLPQLLEFQDYTGTIVPGFLRISLLIVEVILTDLCFKFILNPQTSTC